MKTDVSFVILSYNDADMIVKAVSSIKKLKTKYKYNIFVVDNGSRNDSVEKVKKIKGINLIKLKNNVGTAAYDKAIKKSSSKYIFFTGCDVELKEDMLDYLVNFLEKNKDVAQAAPKYISLNDKKSIDLGGTWLSRSFYSGTFKNNTLGNNPVKIPYIGTGLIRKSFIDKFNYLFDNTYFFYGEDVDLGMRIRLSGHKIYYIPKSIVYHVGSMSRTIHKPAKLTYLMERNLIRTFLSSLSIHNIIILSPYVIAMRLIAMVKDLSTLHFTSFLARLFALIWPILNLGTILKKRKTVQKTRKVKDKKLFSLFSEKYLFFR
ncbi:glycosyltransferase [Candidatus Woesearchaeota archaeon]|nr:glycosyltransferase [Candidatus Woesearchaeota archaeon]